MGLEYLTDVHSARNTKWVQDDVNRSTVCHVRHVGLRKNLRDNTLVTVTSGQLVAHADLALLRNENLDHLVHTRSQLATFVTVEHADVNDLATFTVRHLE